MQAIKIFREFLSGGWTEGLLDTQWKVNDGVLYFQQTSSVLDWVLNFLAAPMKSRMPYKGMPIIYKVHVGFFVAYKINSEEIQKLDFERVAGYSRGGPLAMYAHEDREFRTGKKLENGFAFGCPRGVCKTVPEIRMRWSNFTRYTNPGDIVAGLPFECMGYEHVGREIVLGGNISRPKDVGRLAWATHHTAEEYLQRLEQLKE